ncbi:MAG: hypothetical protein ACYTG7_05965 [Planctomycetota bacterium]|jgi:hypothetical protein
MTQKKMMILGAGKRFQSSTLPVLERLDALYSVVRIFDKQQMTLKIRDQTIETQDPDRFDGLFGDLADLDLIYVAVPKQNVPNVLKRLARHDLSHTDLLIETPVLLFKHFSHVDLFDKFRNVWVAEDCIALPWFDTVRAALDQGMIGELQEIFFDWSAYKYHGLAMLKTLFDCNRITFAKRKKLKAGEVKRQIRFSNRKSGYVLEPRDYSRGRFLLKGSAGSISDYESIEKGNRILAPMISEGIWQGFGVDDMASMLNEDEIALLGEGPGESTITARMDDLKRVGLYRLLKSIHQGEGGYPLEEALDDMVIDYYLDRIGLFITGPFMSVKTGMGKSLLRSFMKIVN